MLDLLELEQEDLYATSTRWRMLSCAGSSLDLDLPGVPRGFREMFARLAEETVAMSLGFAARLRPRWEHTSRPGGTDRRNRFTRSDPVC